MTVSDVCVCRRGRLWEKNRGWPIGHRLGEREAAPRREHVVGNFCFHDGRREMRFTTVVIRLSVSRPAWAAPRRTHARWSLDGWLNEHGQFLATEGASGPTLETIHTAHSHSLIAGLLLMAG